jgi:AraC-like DNA-binding protein
LLMQTGSMLDSGFCDIKIITEKIDQECNLSSLVVYGRDNVVGAAYKRAIRKNLEWYQSYSSYIGNIYVYYPEGDFFVTDQTTAACDILYSAYHRQSAVSLEQWRALFTAQHDGDAFLLPDGDQMRMVYAKSFPAYSETFRYTVFVLVDPHTVASWAQALNAQTDCMFDLVLEGQHLLDSPSRYTPNPQDIVSSRVSDMFDLHYTLVTPKSVIDGRIRRINRIYLLCVCVTLSLAAALTVLFLRRNYNPIKELSDLAVARNQKSIGNELHDIRSALVSSGETEKLLQGRSARLLDSVLALLLHNPVSADAAAVEAIRQVFDQPGFAVILLGLEDASSVPSEQLMDFTAFLDEYMALYHPHISYRLVPAQHNAALILNLNEQKERIGGLCADLREAIAEYFQNDWKTTVLVYSSAEQIGLEHLYQAYAQAEYALRYRQVFGTDYQAAAGQPDAPAEPSAFYYYAPDEENRLYNSVAAGDFEQSLLMFTKIWNNNIGTHHLTAEQRCFLLYDMSGTLIRLASVIPHIARADLLIRRLVGQLNQGGDGEKLKAAYVSCMSGLCECFGAEHARAGSQIHDRVIAYIGTHYADPNLSVEMLSDVFGRSRTYLFSLFKEETGYSLLYHINKVRMEKAKELLAQTALPVQVIAAQVGFHSAVSFSRAFKKNENITPVEYRNLQTL